MVAIASMAMGVARQGILIVVGSVGFGTGIHVARIDREQALCPIPNVLHNLWESGDHLVRVS